MAYIERTQIAGGEVLGVRQYDYEVGGLAHQALIDTVGMLAFTRATAVEGLSTAMAAQMRLRRQKLEDLGECLAEAAAAAAELGDKKSGDAYVSDKLADCYQKLVNWRLDDCVSCLQSNGSVTKAQVGRFQNNVQTAIDRENSKVNQGMVTLKNFIKKRDQSYDNAAKAIEKINHAVESATDNIGR